MKKTLTAILALTLAQSAFPRDIADTAFTWHVNDLPGGGVEITGIDPKPVLEFEVPAAFRTETEIFPVKRIGNGAFANAIGMTSVTLPSTLERIGDSAFADCTSLANVTIPYGVREIGKRPFVNTIITGLALPDSIIKLDGNIAAGALFDLGNALADSSHFLVAEDGAVYNRDQTKLYSCPTRTEGTLVIPDTLTEIGADAFFGCFRLAYLDIPANVSVIGENAFNVAGIWPGLDAPESAAKLRSVNFNGPEPVAADDIFNGSENVSVFGYAADGWSGTEWKGRPLTLLQGRHDPAVLSRTIGNVNWNYTLTADGAVIVDADGATGNVIIPESLGGEPVRKIAPAAFNECHGITGFSVERGCTTLMERNGALYSADGKTLIRVPDTYQLEATVKTQTQQLTLTVTVIPAVNPDGTDGTTYTTNSVNGKVKTSSRTIPSTVPVSTLLNGITSIADHAFTGCGIVEGVGTTTTTNGTGTSTTGFVGDNVYVRTTYDITSTTVSCEEIVCVPENIACGDRAFEGSGVTEVRRTPVDSIRLTATTDVKGVTVAVKTGSDIRTTIGAPFGISLENMLPDGSSSASLSAKGLPAGLKLVKHKDESGNVSYAIEGTPTKQVDGKAITLTAKKGNSLAAELTFTLSTTPLPSGAVGGFSGFISRPADGDVSVDIGTFTLTTTEAGKITAKVITANGSTSFTASHWDSISDSGICSVRMTTRKGEVLDITVDTKAVWNDMQVSGTFSSGSVSGNVTAQKNLFANSWTFTCTGNDTDGWILHAAKDAKSADIKVSLKANGTTSISGKLGSYKVSASGTVSVSVLRDGILSADFVTFAKRGKTKQALSIRTDLRLDRQDPPEGVGRAAFTGAN